MQKFIPKAKLSKKAKRQLDLAQRQTWAINPVSRRSKDKKKYDRKKARSWMDTDGSGLCCPLLTDSTFAAWNTNPKGRYFYGVIIA